MGPLSNSDEETKFAFGTSKNDPNISRICDIIFPRKVKKNKEVSYSKKI